MLILQLVTPDGSDSEAEPEPFKRLDPIGIPRAKRDTPVEEGVKKPPTSPLPPTAESSSDSSDEELVKAPLSPVEIRLSPVNNDPTTRMSPGGTKYTRIVSAVVEIRNLKPVSFSPN